MELRNGTLSAILDTLSTKNAIQGWNMYQNKKGGIVVKIRFDGHRQGERDRESMDNQEADVQNVGYKKMTDKQSQRNFLRAKTFRDINPSKRQRNNSSCEIPRHEISHSNSLPNLDLSECQESRDCDQLTGHESLGDADVYSSVSSLIHDSAACNDDESTDRADMDDAEVSHENSVTDDNIPCDDAATRQENIHSTDNGSRLSNQHEHTCIFDQTRTDIIRHSGPCGRNPVDDYRCVDAREKIMLDTSRYHKAGPRIFLKSEILKIEAEMKRTKDRDKFK